jgi:LysM repeat protein
MTNAPDDRSALRSALCGAVALLLTACAGAPPSPAPPSPTPAPVSAVPQEPPAAAVPPSATSPESSPAAARAQSQKLALEAVDQLQNGDEAAARGTLERAVALDPGNDLARKLNEQIRADAQRELGAAHFRYTVQKDDTLSRLAQQYLGDRFRFYILAKYNDITNPSRLAAGQVIKIPGRAPPAAATAQPAEIPAAATPPPPATAPLAPPRAPEPEPKPRDDVAEALGRAADLERAGNLEAAYAAYTDVAQRHPGSAEASQRRDASRAALLRSLDREATTAFQRQNLELAIAKWDRVLEIDPANRKARLERERALDLKRKLAAKQGAK